MPTSTLDGISTRYEILGSGPPLLMYSPGGFDATVEKWRTQGIYKDIKFLDHLPEYFTCITFDRRECGQSGGRVEPVGWSDYARHGAALLDQLSIDKAHLMGGCMGVSCVAAFGVAYPQRTLSMVLFWPVGGARYRIAGQRRFAEHLAFVKQNGLQSVVDLANAEGKSFGVDPRGGPWVSVLRHDADFAARYVSQDSEAYRAVVEGMGRTLLDRDTAPGPAPEDLLALSIPTLIVPGSDASHAISAARYLEECIPGSQYWNVPVAEQLEKPTNTRVLDFLRTADVGV